MVVVEPQTFDGMTSKVKQIIELIIYITIAHEILPMDRV